jgi:hypothetical protein
MLAGCGASRLDRLQGEYARLALALAAAERGRVPRGAEHEPGIRLQLAALATEAHRAAAGARDDRTAIHLYLIAALSAWQAGAEGESLLAELAHSGTEKCGELEGQRTRPPRDCAQLSVVPALAINDVLAVQLRQLKAIPGEDESRRYAVAAELTDKTRQNFDRLVARRDALLAERELSPSYKRYVDAQLYVIYCNHSEAATQLSLTAAGKDAGQNAKMIAIDELKPSLGPAHRTRDCEEFRD